MLLLLISSLSGILLNDNGSPYKTTTINKETVEIYGGKGLYKNDTTYKAVTFLSFDWTNLIIVLPLFILGLYLYRKVYFKGQLLLLALFTYLAYIYLIGVMGNTFNSMFLIWTALYSLGFAGTIILLLNSKMINSNHQLFEFFPRKRISIYVILVGIILFFQYLFEVISAYISNLPPSSLDHYTTLELASLELGIMIPLHVTAGIGAWKKKFWGYILSTLLTFTASMVFIALSISLWVYLISFENGSIIDIIITNTITIVAIGFSVLIFKTVKESK